VNVAPNPVVLQVNAPTVCQGIATAFTQTSAIGQGGIITGYNWDYGDGNTGTGFAPNHVYAAAGTYTAQLIVVSASGCTDTLAQSVTVNASPVLDSVLVTNACFPNPTNFQAFVSGVNVGNYQWNFGNNASGTGSLATHTYAAAGTYYYQLLVNSVEGCTTVQNGTVLVENQPTANFLPTDGCTNQPLSLVNTSTGNITGWDWNFTTGTSNTQVPAYTYTQAGTYPVSLTVTTPGGCTDTHTELLTIHPTPNASYLATNQGLNLVQFSPGNLLNPAGYLWTFGDGTSSNLSSPLKQYAVSGSYQVCLTISANGCSNTSCQNIEVRDITSISEQNGSGVAFSAYPNPVVDAFNVSIRLDAASKVELKVFDLAGKEISTVDAGTLAAGMNQLSLSADALGMAEGVYVLTLYVEGQPFSLRMVRNK
jgi:PKD repeat protein